MEHGVGSVWVLIAGQRQVVMLVNHEVVEVDEADEVVVGIDLQ